jgi:hypothetical protein
VLSRENYHLSLKQGQNSTQEDDGVELGNDDAAWDEASTTFGELIIDLDREHLAGPEWQMDIKRASGEVVYRLRFSAEELANK